MNEDRTSNDDDSAKLCFLAAENSEQGLRDRLKYMAEKVAELIYPSAAYCIICGNFIDESREYCICDHCIRHIKWGNICVDTRKLAADVSTDSAKQNDYAGVLAERSSVSEIPDSVTACFEYGLYGRRVVFELKYNGHSYVARVGAKMMADRVSTDPTAAALLACDFATAVPVSRQKLKQRGFNQAEKLAKYFCRESGMRHIPDLLVRIKDTEALRSLSPQERYLNLENVFRVDEHKVRTLKRMLAAKKKSTEATNQKSECEAFGTICERSENETGKSLEGMRVLLIDDIYTTGATAKHCTRALRAAGASEVHVLVMTTGSDLAANEKTNISPFAFAVRKLTQ